MTKTQNSTRTVYVLSNRNRYYLCEQSLKGSEWEFNKPVFDCLVSDHDISGLSEKGIQVDLGFTTLDPYGPRYEWIIGTGLVPQKDA